MFILEAIPMILIYILFSYIILGGKMKAKYLVSVLDILYKNMVLNLISMTQ